MMLQETVKYFLESRRRGMTGARKKSGPSTMKIYTANMHAFTSFMETAAGNGGIVMYEHIKKSHIVEFLGWIDQKEQSQEWAKASCLQVLRTLRTFFRWVDLDEDCQDAGLKGLQRYLPAIEKNPRRTDIPQIADLSLFKNGFNTKNRWGYRDYVATCLMLCTGIRLGEVCNLRLDNVLLEDRVLLVSGKTGPRPIPITTEMVGILKGWLRRRQTCKTSEGSPFVFVSKYRPQMAVNAFGARFRKHRRKHNLPRISAHTLRHSFCTHYLKKGGDMEKLRMMTGHTTYEMLKEYLHLAKVGGKAMQDELEKVSLLKDV